MNENTHPDTASADKSEIKKKRSKRRKKKNIIIAVVIVLLLISTACTLYMNMDNPSLYKAFSGIGIDVINNGNVIDFDKTEAYTLRNFEGNAIVARNATVSCIDDKMNTLWSFEQTNSAPVVKTDGKYTLTYSFDVANAVLAKNGKPLVLETANAVIGGNVNKNGYCTVITREKGYKALVIVFSPEGEVVYKWHSAESYIIDAAVSYDNRILAVATADFTQKMTSGGLLFFNFSQEKPYAGQILENNIIMEIKYIGKDTLVAIGDIGAAVFNNRGEKESEYMYDGKKLVNYDIGTDNSIALAFSLGDSVLNDSELTILNSDLDKKGTYTTAGDILCVDSVDGKVLLVCDRKLVLVSSRGNELRKLDVNKDIKKAVLFGNGDDVLVASGGSAEILTLK